MRPPQRDYLRPDLISVEEHSDLRRSLRISPAGLHAEVAFESSPQPRECHCLNISHHGIALLCDLTDVIPGERALLTLWNRATMLRDVPGTVIRVEVARQFTRLAVSFDEQFVANPALKALTRPYFPELLKSGNG
ncbi:PilZ domain-containing protein [Marinobacter sp. M1N3S26]|uniref:PilZ domain-containing protein n=1 Tax=Marinobacter sp. M1N3S26 TaxID=3382299 RepID=UPI00387AC040